MLRQDRHQAEDQRQFAVVAAGEVEAHGARIETLGLADLGIIGAVIGPAVIAQQLPGEHDVVGRDRRAVGKMRRGVEPERDVAPRVVGLDRAREQAVEREGLVIAARHQTFEHVAADRLHGEALDDERIEAVERAEHALHQRSALGRVGIGVGRGDKILRHGRGAMHGDGVGGRVGRGRRHQGEHGDRGAQAERETGHGADVRN